VRRVGIVLAVGLVALASCGSPTAKQAGEHFRAAQSIKIVALPADKLLATVSNPEDLAALAEAVSMGQQQAPCKCKLTLRLVLIYPDGSTGRAYVDLHREDRKIHRGWVHCDGIGPVFPAPLFWDIMDRYVKP